jgi:DNA-binding transcriptional LysR family regulator
MDWESLKYFLALASSGSITQAAKELGVNYTTVARRLAQLEAGLDTKLFIRQSSGIELTAEGRAMLLRSADIGRQLTTLEQDISGKNQAASGTIALTMSQHLAQLLMPALSEFTRQYPAIGLELIADSNNLDIEAREVDVCVRCTTEPPLEAIGRRITETTIAPYARKGDIDPSLSFGDLATHPWIVWDAKRVGGETAQFNAQFLPINAATVLTVSDAPAQLAAVKAGMGLAWLWRYVGDGDDALEIVSSDYPPYHSELWVLMNEELRSSHRHRLLFEHLHTSLCALPAFS